MKVVIMAGGHGERLWPLSRKQQPKQLVKFPLPNHDASPEIANSPLITQTLHRLTKVVSPNDIYLSIQEALFHETRQLIPPSVADSQFILEPQAKDTTTAILLSLLTLTRQEDCLEEVFFFTPSDHYITPLAPYIETLLRAEKVARTSGIFTVVGITPQNPATEYGYLETHPYTDKKELPPLESNLEQQILYISKFHEKPDREKATAYLKKGNFLWNAGMFFCKAGTLLDIFQKLAPEYLEKVQTYLTLKQQNKHEEALEVFRSIDKISFDYTIAEKLDHILCVPAQFTWDDLGSFTALERLHQPDQSPEGNLFLDPTHQTHSFATQNTFVHNAQKKQQTFVLNGLENLSIIVTDDVIYIADKTKALPTKEILKTLSKNFEKLT